MDRYEIPAPTRVRLEKMAENRQRIQAVMEVMLITLREVMGVPEDWVLQGLDEGFVPPPTPQKWEYEQKG